MSDLFYLQDSRSNVGSRAMFWKEGGGYTSNLDEADIFTREKAVQQYEDRETDLPWPKSYVDALAQLGVDFQYLGQEVSASATSQPGPFYVALRRDWDGNDLIWKRMPGDGSPSSNLHDAGIWNADEAVQFFAQGYCVWPKCYIDGKSRRVVMAALLNHKRALRGVGLQLPKVERPRIRRYTTNCVGCGRFLSDRQIYDDCPNCGVSNAP